MEINKNFTENAKNDFHLVVKAREGSQKAYADLMHRYKDSIYFMVLKMVNNKEDANDLMVETFAKAFEKLEKYQPEYAFSTWLFRVATNNCIDFIRKKKLNTQSIHGMLDEDGDEKPLQIKSDLLNPEESSIKKQQTEELKLLIESLPIRYRNLITLRYFDELSYEEIAQQLDLPLGTVKAQLFRARYLLGNVINRHNKDDI
ncbi:MULTISPECIES: sigma-70 family RNA polymerase sigma factor [unclassified Mucilaginibacter]|uniref:RNA polymerase sigma factor n=1 Tax=unclassified Mucilaginibacter TaxID=2617802 RepID=UPI002AC8EC2A|nr:MULTISPECIES: sigma-70 family RNA polymerase sigma factor [unclassified Mucilaginibacter]MEB0249641.1 sigma-70 family RNA polymerase sigma factor [Mucilaginibacter sp. 5B2]MEB0261498.1 sigma-70 family RNA polymerase sigma factor [Mucilaginibacter sp. 10I4]MEB0277865.1 sigma-70 family RNA polymerase sigma factor [Mucilaginibacter sp. 10B2]MEB0300588.1 sigma-70 family RNA polymerase sigma factor [Mucilaginibacter sp. 5C4]WPX22757.1 sigma-70 family RNA polymerase sigma factor [Mucilaginibacter